MIFCQPRLHFKAVIISKWYAGNSTLNQFEWAIYSAAADARKEQAAAPRQHLLSVFFLLYHTDGGEMKAVIMES